jgi:multicomponent Na+:H+ antiporter subunit F
MSPALYVILFSIGMVAVLLCMIRALLGPTASDRLVSVDGMITITTALMVLLGLFLGRGIYLDVALVYAVLAFLAVITVARYLEKGL